MEIRPIAFATMCAVALAFSAPAQARDSSDQTGAAPDASADQHDRASRETSGATRSNADTSGSAAAPLPQGTNPESTKPVESQIGADPEESKKDRDPTAQNRAEPVEAPTPAADAARDGARGPRGDDDSRARANMPEYTGPVQQPGEPADPNIEQQ